MALGLIVDSAGVPIPSEVIIPLAGALAAQGRMNLVVVIIVGALAQTAGAVIAYLLAASGGLALVKRYGKYVFFSEHELAKTQALFERRGTGLTLVGRCLPGIRTYIGYPAGLAQMPFSTFLAASFSGSAAWTIVLALLGYKLSGSLDQIDQQLNRFGIIVLILFVAAFIWYLRRRSQRAKI